MKHTKIAVIGGAGFVGRHIAVELVNGLREVTIVTRAREHAKSLYLLPVIEIAEVDARNADALARATHDCDAIINLVGILNESSGARFGDEHVGLTASAIEACHRNGIRRYVHMSALNADSNGPSKYLRSKGEAEAKVKATGLDWTIFRPSLIVGPEDRSLNTFARIATFMPVLFIPRASARFQPVYVGDVASAFVNALDDHTTYGQAYPLCGPRVYTLRELIRFAAAQVGRKPLVFNTPAFVAPLQAFFLGLMPGKPMTPDNLRSMSVDSVAQGTPEVLIGHPARAIEDTVPEYLAGQDRNGRYQVFRRRHSFPR